MLMKEGWEYKKLGDFIEEVSVRDKGKGYPVYSVTNTKGFAKNFLVRTLQVKIHQIIKLCLWDVSLTTLLELMLVQWLGRIKKRM